MPIYLNDLTILLEEISSNVEIIKTDYLICTKKKRKIKTIYSLSTLREMYPIQDPTKLKPVRRKVISKSNTSHRHQNVSISIIFVYVVV